MPVKFLPMFAISFLLLAAGYLIGVQNRRVAGKETHTPVGATSATSFIAVAKRNRVSEFHVLEMEDGQKLSVVINRVNEPPYEGSDIKECDKITIYNDRPRPIYEYKALHIKSVRTAPLLEPGSREVMFSVNGGGTDNFLKILRSENGRMTEIIDMQETQHRGEQIVLSQYRGDTVSPYSQPSFLILVRRSGNMDENPSAAVFRSIGDRFQKVGNLKMQELGDLIEKSVAKSH